MDTKKSQFRASKTLCVYCGKREAVTSDHVIPRALFVAPRPHNLVTVPSCEICNQDKKRYDEFLRDMLALDDFTDIHTGVAALMDGPVQRAVGRNQSWLARELRRRGELRVVESPNGILLGPRFVMRLDDGSVEKVLMYIVKGLTYETYGHILPLDAVIEPHHLGFGAFGHLCQELGVLRETKGPVRLGDDICVWASLYLDKYNACWLISFFRDRWFSVSVSSPNVGATVQPEQPSDRPALHLEEVH